MDRPASKKARTSSGDGNSARAMSGSTDDGASNIPVRDASAESNDTFDFGSGSDDDSDDDGSSGAHGAVARADTLDFDDGGSGDDDDWEQDLDNTDDEDGEGAASGDGGGSTAVVASKAGGAGGSKNWSAGLRVMTTYQGMEYTVLTATHLMVIMQKLTNLPPPSQCPLYRWHPPSSTILADTCISRRRHCGIVGAG